MEQYYTFFLNISSRKWLGTNNEKTTTIEESKVTDIYFETLDTDCIILLGKTENFYFVLECFDSEGYEHSKVFYNGDLVELLQEYQRVDLTQLHFIIQQIIKDPTKNLLKGHIKITKTLTI